MTRRAVVSASAPTRIDLAGGTLDIWPLSVLVPGAITINVAIDLPAFVTLEPLGSRRLELISEDRGCSTHRALPLGPTAIAGPLALPLRLIRAFGCERGMRVKLRATAPAGAGLGGSSTLAVSLGAALNRFTEAGLSRSALFQRVMNTETAQLRVPTGSQDYLAALNGGLAAYHHGVDGVRREAIPIPPGLGNRLVLAYTGEPRHSGFSNWEMFRRFVEAEPSAVRRMERIAELSTELLEALRAGDLDRLGGLLGEEGQLRYRLAPTVATPALLAAGAAARRAGALGVKVCGAGGGGCLVAIAREGGASTVAAAMTRTGATVLPVRIARRGVSMRVSES